MTLNALHQWLFDQTGRFVTHRVGVVMMLAGQGRNGGSPHQLALLLLLLLLKLLLLLL